MPGLAAHTDAIFDKVTTLKCIEPYWLVGGTALSLQIHNRLSEDLDFMCWRTHKKQKLEVDWVSIEKEFSSIGTLSSKDICDYNHIEFILDGVKISFYISDKYSPINNTIDLKNKLKMADIESIAAMKMEVMLRRSNFRDYYDIYSILKKGVDFIRVLELSLSYSGHALSTKNLLAILTDSSRFKIDSGFLQLEPVYSVTPQQIELYLRDCIKKNLK